LRCDGLVTELKRGTVIGDKVRLVRLLGEGAMGTVWVAHHLALDTEVAVKFISRKMTGDRPEVLSRFEMEAKATARIKSPHIVQVFDAGVANDTPYIVMELLEGESLATRLERTGWLSFVQCEQVVSQVARALGRAHDLGVVHRDIKPENIFLCPSEDGIFVKLLDFGVAKATDLGAKPGLTSPGVLVGTPEYMSREQLISSREVDHLADLWALAVLAYEMVTGDVPFTGETVAMICLAICNGEFVPPSELRKGVPAELDAWFGRATHRDASQRFQTARELAVAFRSALLPDEFSIDDELSRETPIDSLLAERPHGKKPTRVGLGSRWPRIRTSRPVSASDAPASTEPPRGSLAPVSQVPPDSRPSQPEPSRGPEVADTASSTVAPPPEGAAARRRVLALVAAAGVVVFAAVLTAVSVLGTPPAPIATVHAVPPSLTVPIEHPAPPRAETAPPPPSDPTPPEPTARATASAAPSARARSGKAKENGPDPSGARPDYGF
jgi:serine/threonine-protein kinase